MKGGVTFIGGGTGGRCWGLGFWHCGHPVKEQEVVFVLRATEDLRQLWELDGVLILVQGGKKRGARRRAAGEERHCRKRP